MSSANGTNVSKSTKSQRNVAANDVELIVRKKLITTTTTTTMTPLDGTAAKPPAIGNDQGAEDSVGGSGCPLEANNSYNNTSNAINELANSEIQQQQDAAAGTATPPGSQKIMNITTERIVNQQQANPKSTADAVASFRIDSINNTQSIGSTEHNIIISSSCCNLQQAITDNQEATSDSAEFKKEISKKGGNKEYSLNLFHPILNLDIKYILYKSKSSSSFFILIQ